MVQKKMTRLGDMKKGAKGIISKIQGDATHPEGFIQRLLEMGLFEGSSVEVIHEAPFGGDPFAIKVRGTVLALRRHEANAVEVELIEVILNASS
jgi:ferrous iron transport protein A